MAYFQHLFSHNDVSIPNITGKFKIAIIKHKWSQSFHKPYLTKVIMTINLLKRSLLTVYFVRAVNDCICCMSVSDEIHAVFLTVQGSLWSAEEMDSEKNHQNLPTPKSKIVM